MMLCFQTTKKTGVMKSGTLEIDFMNANPVSSTNTLFLAGAIPPRRGILLNDGLGTLLRSH